MRVQIKQYKIYRYKIFYTIIFIFAQNNDILNIHMAVKMGKMLFLQPVENY